MTNSSTLLELARKIKNNKPIGEIMISKPALGVSSNVIVQDDLAAIFGKLYSNNISDFTAVPTDIEVSQDIAVLDYMVKEGDTGINFRLVAPGLDEASLEIAYTQPDQLSVKGSLLNLYTDEDYDDFEVNYQVKTKIPIDANAVFTAEYTKGILSITLPFVQNAVVKIPLKLPLPETTPLPEAVV